MQEVLRRVWRVTELVVPLEQADLESLREQQQDGADRNQQYRPDDGCPSDDSENLQAQLL